MTRPDLRSSYYVIAQIGNNHWLGSRDSSSSLCSDPPRAIVKQCIFGKHDWGVGVVCQQYHDGQCDCSQVGRPSLWWWIRKATALCKQPLREGMRSGMTRTSKGERTHELVFGYASVGNRVSGGEPGFNMRQTAGGNMSEDMIVTATGSYAA